MSKLLTALGAIFSALALAPGAHAAMCIRLFSQPAVPVAGALAQIGLRTYVPLPNGELRPSMVRGYPFRVQAVAPGGRIHRLSVRPSERNEYVWVGSFRFGQRGVWTIRVANFPGSPKGCAEVLRLRVRPAHPA